MIGTTLVTSRRALYRRHGGGAVKLLRATIQSFIPASTRTFVQIAEPLGGIGLPQARPDAPRRLSTAIATFSANPASLWSREEGPDSPKNPDFAEPPLGSGPPR